MEPQTNNQVLETKDLTHPVNQITPVSKYLALVLFILLPFIGGYVGWNFAQNNPPEVTEVSNQNELMQVDTKPSDVPASTTPAAAEGIGTHTNEKFGFSLNYPVTWNMSGEEVENKDYQMLVRIVNPAHPGKPDTDAFTEQILVRRIKNSPCAGSPITFSGVEAFDTGWKNSDFYAGDILERTVCIPQANDWPIDISAFSLNDSSKVTIDEIFNSFKFNQ